MCKKILLMAVALCMAGCGADQGINVWGLAEDNVAEARIGYRLTQTTEVGLSGAWTLQDAETGIVGLYGVVQYPESVMVPNPLAAIVGPAHFYATGYVGILASMNIDGDRTWTGWIGGAIIEDILVMEYQSVDYSDDIGDRLPDDQRVLLGLRFPIP